MACVSLKRPLDLDPLEALHSPNRHQSKRQRCTPLKGIERDSDSSCNSPQGSPSVFRESTLTPAEIANQLREKLKPLRRQVRRQIITDDAMTSHNNQTFMAGSSGSETGSQQLAEKPVFTLKQMTAICEKMCKERTDQVRAEYDLILQQKLSEQYDSFVKFIDIQIQQRFNQSQLPSYLS